MNPPQPRVQVDHQWQQPVVIYVILDTILGICFEQEVNILPEWIMVCTGRKG